MTATAVATPDPDEPEVDEPDLSVLLPDEGHVDVEGVPCRVRRLRSREVLDLARVIAAGVGSAVTDMDWDFTDREAFSANATALLIIALPAAPEETFHFLRQMVVPLDSKQGDRVDDLMQNPDLGVALDILNLAVEQEGPGLLDTLGKALTLVGAIEKILPAKLQKKTPAPPSGRAGRGGRSRARST